MRKGPILSKIFYEKKIIFSAIVLFEVYYKTIQYQGLEAAQLRYATLKSIKADHISELTEPVLLKGGEIKAVHQISLAGSIIVAHAFIYDINTD
jgi:predicted nucleic acid-binding protein|tara:strand:- start:30768 stop:31049 length:282 start_codon:yes stop_codon:yes gene_type:complete